MTPPKSLASREAALDYVVRACRTMGDGWHEAHLAGQEYATNRILALLRDDKHCEAYVPPGAYADWLEAKLKEQK